MEEKEIKEKEHKYSYEQLEEIARRATAENLKLREAIEALSDNRGIQRLEFLFKIVEHPVEFPDDVYRRTTKEIVEALFPVEEVSNSSKKDE